MSFQDERGGPLFGPRGFESLSGSPAVLTASAADQTFSLTQVIPTGGCQMLIVVEGGSGVVFFRKDSTAATTANAVPILCNTMTTWGINVGDTPRIIADAAGVGAVVFCTLGNGG